MVNCPVCDTVIDIDADEVEEGDELTCEECGATLGVVTVTPLELEAVEEEEEEDEDFDLDEDEEEEEEEEEWK